MGRNHGASIIGRVCWLTWRGGARARCHIVRGGAAVVVHVGRRCRLSPELLLLHLDLPLLHLNLYLLRAHAQSSSTGQSRIR